MTWQRVQKGWQWQNETVGVIGLGLMGEVLAGRLMAAGFGVMGYDIDPAKNARLAERGGTAAASPAEVAACGVIALAVFSTDQVEEVVEKALLPAVAAGHGRALHLHLRSGPDRGAGRAARRQQHCGFSKRRCRARASRCARATASA